VCSLLAAAGLGAAGSLGQVRPAARAAVVLGEPGSLPTAVQDYDIFSGPNRNPDLALSRIKAAGATAMRLTLNWRFVAPAGTTKPLGFVATDPLDPHYQWGAFDQEVKLVAAHGLEPIVIVFLAPAWAEDSTTGPAGTRTPNPAELGAFAKAAALRYSGSLPGLPRVRYWQVWNEPNLSRFLSPQIEDGKDVSPGIYRAMVNQMTAAVHNAQPDALVIAGGNSAYGGQGVPVPSVAPLRFMRELLCMSGGKRPHATCKAHTAFDVWSHHPYTAGDPGHHAYYPDNVSLPDLPRMRSLLTAAVRAKHIVSAQRPLFWVTEFSWDTSPPDAAGAPAKLQARWVSEALYRMWTYGVSLVTWFQLRDQPMSASIFQSGLYYDDGSSYRLNEPKPGLAAFRFPFVAYKVRGRILIWGRVPPQAGRTRVRVEQTIGLGWRTCALLRPNRFGIFQARLKLPRYGSLRARVGTATSSLPFSLKAPPPLQLWSPFGR
jgi:hypothetical protein